MSGGTTVPDGPVLLLLLLLPLRGDASSALDASAVLDAASAAAVELESPADLSAVLDSAAPPVDDDDAGALGSVHRPNQNRSVADSVQCSSGCPLGDASMHLPRLAQ